MVPDVATRVERSRPALSRPRCHGAHARAIYQTVRAKAHRLQFEAGAKLAASCDVEWTTPFLDRDLIAYLIAVPGEIQNRGGVPRALLRDAMREVVAVGRAQGVLLAEDFADDRLAFSDGLPATMTSSMHNDLERGNRLEVAGLSGDVVERGIAVGVPTPINRAIYDILLLHAEGKGPV
jgi:ketopantoate reductase